MVHLQSTEMSNDLIVANLQVLLKDAQGSREPKDKFRAKAYQNAIKAIKNCNYPLTSGKDAQKLEGVGKKIADKIQEILDTGELTQVQILGPDQLTKTKTLTLFSNIWGVGPVKAKELWATGARSIEDVEQNCQYLLTDNQRIGLKYFADLQQRVPRKQVTGIYRSIIDQLDLLKIRYGWKINVRACGSYRRKEETCGDMDILLCETSGKKHVLKTLVERLIECKIVYETLGIGPTKYMGITRTSRGTAFRIDMEIIKVHEWPFALLYFTGSGKFNEKQRLVAKKMGFSLSEHGLKNVDTGEYITGIKTERQIFEYLGMEYLDPWNRKIDS